MHRKSQVNFVMLVTSFCIENEGKSRPVDVMRMVDKDSLFYVLISSWSTLILSSLSMSSFSQTQMLFSTGGSIHGTIHESVQSIFLQTITLLNYLYLTDIDIRITPGNPEPFFLATHNLRSSPFT